MSDSSAPFPDAIMNPQSQPFQGSSEQPTWVRYRVLAFLAAMTFVLYLDRACISKAGPRIQEELGISNTAMGFVYAAFTLSYAIFEIPTGRWGDRYGSRGVLARIVIWWSFFTAMTGAALGFWMLVVVRFLFGAGEAGALPNSARVLRAWFPETSRGRAQGLVIAAMMIGGTAAPVASQFLIDRIGWRWTFVVFGLLGVIWASLFYLWFRDNPVDHPATNDAELALIAQCNRPPGPIAEHAEPEAVAPDLIDVESPEPTDAHGPIPWNTVWSCPNIWLLSGAMVCMTSFFYMLISWYPTYLEKARGATPYQSGWLATMVLGAGACGSLFGGWFSDWLVKKTGSRRWGRTTQGMVGAGIAGMGILTSLFTSSTVMASVFIAISCFFAQLQTPAWLACATLVSGKHLGALFGLMNMVGAIGAILSQLFLGSFADWMKSQGYVGRAQWDPGFFVYVVIALIGMTLWSQINPEKTVDNQEPRPASI